MKNLSRGVLLFVVFACLLVACGGSAVGNSPSTSLSVDMSEFMFNPTDFTVAAGQEISLELKNSGSVEHNFIILKKGVLPKTPFDVDAQKDGILFQARLGTAQTGSFKFTVPEAGEYQVLCGIPGHAEAGMKAKLVAK